jgi:hypothetical protein
MDRLVFKVTAVHKHVVLSMAFHSVKLAATPSLCCSSATHPKIRLLREAYCSWLPAWLQILNFPAQPFDCYIGSWWAIQGNVCSGWVVRWPPHLTKYQLQRHCRLAGDEREFLQAQWVRLGISVEVPSMSVIALTTYIMR